MLLFHDVYDIFPLLLDVLLDPVLDVLVLSCHVRVRSKHVP